MESLTLVVEKDVLPSTISECIESKELALSRQNLADILALDDFSWYLEEAIRRAKIDVDGFEMDFQVYAKKVVMHLLKGEDENKFGILIEDINKPHHERTDATNVMLSAVAKNIKVIAS